MLYTIIQNNPHLRQAHLRIDANDLVALLARIRKHILVALDAIGMIIPDHIALSRQTLVALPATEVARMPILVHGLCVFATEN